VSRGSVLAVALATALAAAAPAAAAPVRYRVDPTHAAVHAEWRPEGLATLRLRFARVQGTVSLDRDAGRGRAEIAIALASASSGIATLDARLRGAALLAVGRDPQARFVGEGFRFDAASGAVQAVNGVLALRGVERPVRLQASGFRCYTNLLFGREVCGGDFEATIRPADWGIVLPPQAAAAASLRLLVQVEAIRDEP